MKTSPSHQRGSALVAVIWLIAILAMATVAALRVVSFDVDISTAQIHGFRARQLAEMGIALKDGKDPETGEPVTTWEVKR